MLEPLEVIALDATMCRLTGSIPYRSLQWRRRTREYGSFALQVAKSLYSPEWKFIYTDDRRETGIIEKVSYLDDALTPEGEDTITIEGRFLEALLDRYTFLWEEADLQERILETPVTRFNSSTDDKQLGGAAYGDQDGILYTYDRGGNLQGHTLAGADGRSDTIPISDVVEHEDKSITVTYLDGTVKTAVPTGKYHENYNVFNYIKEIDGVKKLVEYHQDVSGTFKGELVFDEFYTDSRGGVFTRNPESGVWSRTIGVTENVEDTYYFTVPAFHRKAAELGAVYDKDRREWVYYVPVKGAWQRTEVEDIGKEMDSVEQLILWVRFFFKNTLAYAEPEITGVTKVMNPSMKNLGDLLREELNLIDATFSIDYSFTEDKFLFSIWRGKDRTQSQTENPWATFSSDWGTIYGYEASWDISDYRNKCFVLLDYTVPASFDLYGKPEVKRDLEWGNDGYTYTLKGWEMPTKQTRRLDTVRLDDGMEDRECYLDLRSEVQDQINALIPQTYWEVDPDDEENLGKPQFDQAINYEQRIKEITDVSNRGMQFLKDEHPFLLQIEGGTYMTDSYLTGWDLGDKVDVDIREGGFHVVKEAYVIGVDEVYEPNSSQIRPIFGDEATKLVAKEDDAESEVVE